MDLLLEKEECHLTRELVDASVEMRSRGSRLEDTAIVTELPIWDFVLMWVQHIQIRIRNKELGANASPNFTYRQLRAQAATRPAQTFPGISAAGYSATPQCGPGDVKNTLPLFHCLTSSPISASKQISSDLSLSGNCTSGIYPVLLFLRAAGHDHMSTGLALISPSTSLWKTQLTKPNSLSTR